MEKMVSSASYSKGHWEEERKESAAQRLLAMSIASHGLCHP